MIGHALRRSPRRRSTTAWPPRAGSTRPTSPSSAPTSSRCKIGREELRDGYVRVLNELYEPEAYFDRIDALFLKPDFEIGIINKRTWWRLSRRWLISECKAGIESLGLFCRVEDLPDVRPPTVVGVQCRQQELRVAVDHGQQIVEVVRHSAGQLSRQPPSSVPDEPALRATFAHRCPCRRQSFGSGWVPSSGRYSCTSGNPMHGTVRPNRPEFVDEIGLAHDGAFNTVSNRRPILRMNQRNELVIGCRRLRRRKTKDRHQTVGPFEPIRFQIEFPYTHLRRRQRELCPYLCAAPISNLLLEGCGSRFWRSS